MTKQLLFISCAIAFSGCSPYSRIPEVVPPSTAGTTAQDVTVCDLKEDPPKYNHKVVKVKGYFSRGFEVSALYDPTCESDQVIWVELGGKRSVDVMYCCGVVPKAERDEELEVEGIELPLTEDDKFILYNKLLSEGENVKATVIGTYFSGERIEWPGRVGYGGFGHFGIGSLFIVQRVLSTERTSVKIGPYTPPDSETEAPIK
ncbi:MAG: hypothetical protein WBO10_16690 [Pyrinomonadaceae bacterium]